MFLFSVMLCLGCVRTPRFQPDALNHPHRQSTLHTPLTSLRTRRSFPPTNIHPTLLYWIDGDKMQGDAIVFVAKLFGCAGLMSFLTTVSEP
jgi:hypothetical protein